MGLAGGLFLRQAKDHDPCAVPCDTWASGIRELPVEVIAMPSAQRDLSHSSPSTYTHMHPCRAGTFTGVKRTSVRLHICMTSPDLSQHLFFPFSTGIWHGPVVLDLLPFQIQWKKKPEPELLIGLGLICYHHKGKERTLSCAFAINNSQSCIINHEQELGESLHRWRKKEGMGKEGRILFFCQFPTCCPYSETIGFLVFGFQRYLCHSSWEYCEMSHQDHLYSTLPLSFPPRPSLFQTVYTPIDPYKLYITRKKKVCSMKEAREKKTTPEERGGKSPPASCKHAVAREAVQHFQCHSLNNTNYQPKTC